MTDSKAMRPLLALLLFLAAASASAAPPVVEKEADWRWSEEPRNAHNYRQDFGRKISAAVKEGKSPENDSKVSEKTAPPPIGERRSAGGFDTLLQARSGTAPPGSTSKIRSFSDLFGVVTAAAAANRARSTTSAAPTTRKTRKLFTWPPPPTNEQTSGRSANTAVSANPVSISPQYSDPTYDEDFFGEDEEYLNALDVNHPDSPYGLIQNVLFPSEKPKPPRVIPHGVDPKDVWLSDGSLLVLRGGTTESKEDFDDPWPPLDDYEAPYREPLLAPSNLLDAAHIASKYASAGVVVVPPPTKRARTPKKSTTKFTSTRPTSSAKSPTSDKSPTSFSTFSLHSRTHSSPLGQSDTVSTSAKTNHRTPRLGFGFNNARINSGSGRDVDSGFGSVAGIGGAAELQIRPSKKLTDLAAEQKKFNPAPSEGWVPSSPVILSPPWNGSNIGGGVASGSIKPQSNRFLRQITTGGAVSASTAVDINTLHQQQLDHIHQQQFRQPSNLGLGTDTVYKSVTKNLQGNRGFGSLGLYQSGEPTAHTQVAQSSPPSVPTAPSYKTSSVDGGGIFNKISAPQQRHQPAYRSATTYHYSSSPSPPPVASTGGTVADTALALPNSFDWQQRQRDAFGFQFGSGNNWPQQSDGYRYVRKANMVPVSHTSNTAFVNGPRQIYSGTSNNNRFNLSQNPGSFTQFYTFPGNRRMLQQQQQQHQQQQQELQEQGLQQQGLQQQGLQLQGLQQQQQQQQQGKVGQVQRLLMLQKMKRRQLQLQKQSQRLMRRRLQLLRQTTV